MQYLRTAAIACCLLLAAAAHSEPSAVVESFHDSLLQAMQAESHETRLDIVNQSIDDHFQLNTIARISLGRNWRSLPEQDKERYLALLHELITTTYASRFNNYDGQSFQTNDSKSIGKNRMRVRTVLSTKSENVNLDYQLQVEADSWQIYDIVANGVSDLSLKRSNFAALFASGGFDAVASDIRTSINKNREDLSD